MIMVNLTALLSLLITALLIFLIVYGTALTFVASRRPTTRALLVVSALTYLVLVAIDAPSALAALTQPDPVNPAGTIRSGAFVVWLGLIVRLVPQVITSRARAERGKS